MLRILHCADLHLEASFAADLLPGVVARRRRADLRAALDRIVTLVRDQQVDAVTIAGDLYEQEFVPSDLAAHLAQQFSRLAPVRVYIAPGEHDSYGEGSLYALTSWPDNVTIFEPGPLVAMEVAPDVHLWGAACPPAGDGTLRGHRVRGAGVNLLLLHASPTGEAEEGLYRVDEAAVRAAGFDLALLGHQHTGRIWPTGHARCVYPGSPEPLAAAETGGDHQAVLLTIEDGDCSLEGLPLSQWRYLSLAADLAGCSTIGEAAARVRAELRRVPGGIDERCLFSIALAGSPSLDLDLDLAALASQIDSPAHVRYALQVPPEDLRRLAQEPTVRGLLVQRFEPRLAGAAGDEQRSLALRALNLALAALDGKQVRPDESDQDPD